MIFFVIRHARSLPLPHFLFGRGNLHGLHLIATYLLLLLFNDLLLIFYFDPAVFHMHIESFELFFSVLAFPLKCGICSVVLFLHSVYLSLVRLQLTFQIILFPFEVRALLFAPVYL